METVEAEYVDSLIEGLPENPVLSDKDKKNKLLRELREEK